MFEQDRKELEGFDKGGHDLLLHIDQHNENVDYFFDETEL